MTGCRGSPIVLRSAAVELEATSAVADDPISSLASATDNAKTRLVGVFSLARNVGENVNDSLSLWTGPCEGENGKTAVAGWAESGEREPSRRSWTPRTAARVVASTSSSLTVLGTSIRNHIQRDQRCREEGGSHTVDGIELQVGPIVVRDPDR